MNKRNLVISRICDLWFSLTSIHILSCGRHGSRSFSGSRRSLNSWISGEKKQTKSTHHIHSHWRIQGRVVGGTGPPSPPPHLSVKDSIQCKKETWVCLFYFFHNMSNFILKVFLCLLLLVTWESGLDKVSTEIQGFSSTDYNFQGLSRWVRTRCNSLLYLGGLRIYGRVDIAVLLQWVGYSNLTCFSWFNHLVLHRCGCQGYCLQVKWRSVRGILHICIQSSLQAHNGHLKT